MASTPTSTMPLTKKEELELEYPLHRSQCWRSKFTRLVRIRNNVAKSTLAEFFATFMLMVNIQGTIAARIFARRTDDILLISFGQGLSVMLAVYVGGGASGAFLNPAVTVGFAILGKLSWIRTLLYILAQYAGSFVASSFVYVLTYEAMNKFDGGVRLVTGENATAGIFATYTGDHRSISGAFIHEILCTMFLMIGVLALSDHKNWKPKKGLFPISVGLLITLLCLSFGYQEALALNPARDLAPRIFTAIAGWGTEVFSVRNYNWFWVPIVGPHIGGVLGAVLYFLFVEAHWDHEHMN